MRGKWTNYGNLDRHSRPETACCGCRIPRAASNRRGPAAGIDATGRREVVRVTSVRATTRWEDVVVVGWRTSERREVAWSVRFRCRRIEPPAGRPPNGGSRPAGAGSRRALAAHERAEGGASWFQDVGVGCPRQRNAWFSVASARRLPRHAQPRLARPLRRALSTKPGLWPPGRCPMGATGAKPAVDAAGGSDGRGLAAADAGALRRADR